MARLSVAAANVASPPYTAMRCPCAMFTSSKKTTSTTSKAFSLFGSIRARHGGDLVTLPSVHGTPLRVLFLFERAEGWINVHGLWAEMRADRRFEAQVWLIPAAGVDLAIQEERRRRCLGVAEERGISPLFWGDALPVLEAGMFDVAIFNLPYDMQRPAMFHFDEVARKVRHSVYIPYGLVTGGGRKNEWIQYAQPTQRRAHLIVARSQFELQAYRRHCPSGDRRVAVLGLPRLDELSGIADFEIDQELRSQVRGRFTVLWNSHYAFSLRHANSANYSTFDRLANALFSFASKRPDVALIWRPHPHLFSELVASGIFRQEELPTFKLELEHLGVILDERSDHRHSFAASHALLTDAGSFLIEYLATGNPVLYLRCPDGEPLNEEARALLKYYEVAESEAEVIAFVEDLCNNGDRRRDERLAAQSIFLPMFDGRASWRVAERIADLCSGAWPPSTGADCVPLVDRLESELRQIRRRKSRKRGLCGIGYRAAQTKRWVADQIRQRAALARIATTLRDLLGRKRSSLG